MIDEILGNSSPIYILWGLGMLALSLILVSREKYRVLLPVTLLGTTVTAFILVIVIHLIQAWQYIEVEPFSVFDVPVFVLLAWLASFVIFLWALPEDLPVWTHYLYIALFSLAGKPIDTIFNSLGLRPYAPWYQAWMWTPVVFLLFWTNYKIYLFRNKLQKQ
ncbi:hypothetical protein [Dethiobacter alkaliphilus]|uniref:hypothetical protein n=1 Tax=Dethiobacter alkaliphilus TaxID=427926 RepID=UPI0022274289|nr:hypothetical protein [Dethiobacter alkaliphilus]MCW3490127.1 hypothetical protein [Dethiobacter alkaliphilus]